MTNIEQKFNSLQKTYPNLSDVIILGRAIMGSKINQQEISTTVENLLDKSECPRSLRSGIVNHYSKLANDKCFK